MSAANPSLAKPTTRPRRASRMPTTKLADENSNISSTTSTNSRLMAKSSSASLAATTGRNLGKSAVSAASVHQIPGKVLVDTSAAAAGPRRALGNVSTNAAGRANPIDRISKDSVTGFNKSAAGTTRSRTTSAPVTQQSVQPPSSTGTGLARLKIGSSTTAAAATKQVRASRAPVGVKAVGTSLRGAEFPGAAQEVEHLAESNENAAAAKVGLGISMPGEIEPSSTMTSPSNAVSLKRQHFDVEASEDEFENDEDSEFSGKKVRAVETENIDPEDWLNHVHPSVHAEREQILATIKSEFEEELDFWDTSMVAEYSDEIFAYMAELETQAMANPQYMQHQTEIEWSMRSTLIDWLLQVHMRYHMLPETLWIAINIVDRFLSNRVVSLVKFQLVGVTAMFVAAKYEEIMAPSVDEFVFMTEGGYTRDEILKGERIILQSLEFNISPYCSPYSWVRRISKADDYDIQTRTLSKFLMEVSLLDHRFLRAKPSLIAAIGMYLARRMLGGDWNSAFIYYSNYTEQELIVPSGFLVGTLLENDFEQKFVYRKYANKKFLKASIFARNWARTQAAEEAAAAAESSS